MSNININLYRTFIAVAESKSFAEASEKLGTNDRAISNDINALEKQLDVQLFYRKHKGSNNGMKITEIGAEIYPQVKKIISACDFIRRTVESGNSLESGTLSIGCSANITESYLMEKLVKLAKDHPNVKVKLDSESSDSKMIEKLKNNEIDFIIMDEYIAKDLEELEVKRIKDISNIFVSKEKINIKDMQELENYKFILNYEDRTSIKKLIEVMKPYNLKMEAIMRCPTTKLRKEAAKSGMGIAYVVKDLCKNELENKELYELKLPIEMPITNISLVYQKEQLTKVDEEFIKEYLNV